MCEVSRWWARMIWAWEAGVNEGEEGEDAEGLGANEEEGREGAVRDEGRAT